MELDTPSKHRGEPGLERLSLARTDPHISDTVGFLFFPTLALTDFHLKKIKYVGTLKIRWSRI